MKYFDAHTHVQFAAFADDVPEVMARAREKQVGMNIVGTQYDTSAAAVALAEAHEDTWASVGLHPIHTSRSFHDPKELGEGGNAFVSRGEQFDAQKYEALALSKKVVAIGECGLDYYRLDEATKKIQIENFVAQIELANKLGKPLMLHVRQAYADALELLHAHAKVKGNVHFFAGTWDAAKQFLDLGFTLSFTGVITFARDYDDVLKHAPLDMMLAETDAPYVAPVPFRGKRNEPAYVPEIVKAIANIKGVEEERAREQLCTNARRFFRV